MQRTVFIVREPGLLARLSHLPHICLALPPRYSNSSLAYRAGILSSLAQWPVPLLLWSTDLPLVSSPLQLLEAGPGPGPDLVAGRCGSLDTRPGLRFLLLRGSLPAFLLVLTLRDQQPGTRQSGPEKVFCSPFLVAHSATQYISLSVCLSVRHTFSTNYLICLFLCGITKHKLTN